MFGNNTKNSITLEQLEEILAPLAERIELLEKEVRKQTERVGMLEQQLANATITEPVLYDEVADVVLEKNSSSASLESPTSTYYLPAPTPDGLFLEDSRSEQVGKSIYQLRTEDGVNGQFIMLSTPDAIATATISVSQFVKPVCRIEGNIHQLPRQIETIEEGVAQKDGSVWKVVRKAKVLFLP